MLATTRSPRTSSEREIANWESGADLELPPYARIRGTFDRRDGSHSVEIGMSLDERGQGVLKKQVKFDDRSTRAIDVVGQMKSVLFSPEDVNLVSGPPAARRRYLDVAIGQASRTYLKALSRYGKVLEQRNSLLRSFSRERVSTSSPRLTEELAFWDNEFAALAAEVLAERLGAVQAIAGRARFHYQLLTGIDSLDVVYAPSRIQAPRIDEAPEVAWQSPSQTLRQSLLAAMAHSLKDWREEELRRGVTAIGPHKDDFSVSANGIDLNRFGSRGQQRLAMISIKLAELDLLENSAGEPPILLLDDVLSELDATHREKVIAILAAKDAQICITSTELADLRVDDLDHLALLSIRGGSIERFHGPE